MASNRYAVIEFKDGVSLATEKWMTPRKRHCYWPPYRNESRLLKAVENQEDVSENWPQHDIIKILASTKTFKRGQTKCTEALVMSDINTDLERDNIGSKKSTQSSVIIRPFPPIDIEGAACFSSGNEDSDIETIKKRSAPKTSLRSNTKDPISSINKPSVIEGTVQSNLTLKKLNDWIITILTALAKFDMKIDALAAEVRNIGLILAAKTTDEEIDKTESQILKAFPLKKEADLAEVEQRLSTDANYKNTMVSSAAVSRNLLL
ncbi:uncharacterized protein LOC124293883 [Neodiprion lecontei]|uniref:Uncharacterized protein LOC124293883 n=1 Tax=Neodiprion lecontei TaxID=441921 RepID=A0ABM3FXB4_NEOLC|nr:uncharacterized protein LOC124293883 [Neodiprion lecontei]